MRNRITFKVELEELYVGCEFDLIGMAVEWRQEHPEGTLDEFLDWAQHWAYEKFNESFDPWDHCMDMLTRNIEVERGFEMTGTEWELMRQIKGQLDIFGGEVE